MVLHLSPADVEESLKIQQELEHTTINNRSFLSTDYMNHYNEIIMLLEMVADMPDLWDEIKDWSPKSYQDFFREGSFSFKELAIKAYMHAPLNYRVLFDQIVHNVDDMILSVIEEYGSLFSDQEKKDAYQTGEIESFLSQKEVEEIARKTQYLRSQVDVLSSIINGTTSLEDDLAHMKEDDQASTIAQASIDELF